MTIKVILLLTIIALILSILTILQGSVDGEGSFIVKIMERSRLKVGFEVQLCFKITSHTKDRALLESIRDRGIGSLHSDGGDCLQYRGEGRGGERFKLNNKPAQPQPAAPGTPPPPSVFILVFN